MSASFPQLRGRELTVPDLAIMWAVPRDAVIGWLRSGALAYSEHGIVTSNEVLKFVESVEGRALIAAARA